MRIGADHAAVETTGRTFDLTAEAAQLTGQQASGYSEEMASGVAEITTRLKNDFGTLAAQLSERVSAHRRELDSTDWAGASKDSALLVEQALNVEVEQALQHADEAVDRFGQMLHQRAESFRGAVEAEFLTAMTNADRSYRELAQASRTFLSELQAADQTIRFGG